MPEKGPTQDEGSSKWKTYILTFMAYVALHTMRMSYSQIKPDFQQSYELSNLYLGIFDAFVYIALGLGFFFRFLLEGNKSMMSTYLLFIMVASVAYLIIPVSSILLGQDAKNNVFFRQVIPGLCLCLFGFFQFPAWPTLLTSTTEHFDLKKEGKQIGFWSANGDVGNIVGFALTGFIVHSLDLRWEIAMIVATAFHIIMALWVFISVKRKPSKEYEGTQQSLLPNPEKQQKSGKQKFVNFLQFSKNIIAKTQNSLYLLSMALLKSILYGFLLWMPTYLSHKGLQRYQSSTLIIFNAGTLIGSFVLGSSYTESDPDAHIVQKHLKSYALVYSCCVVTITFFVFYMISFNPWAYWILSLVCGACLGGCFNMLASNQVIFIVKGDQEKVNLLSTLSMVTGDQLVGFVEIIIGVVLDLKHDSEGEEKLFLIMIGLGVMSIVTLLVRARIQPEKSQQPQGQELKQLFKE